MNSNYKILIVDDVPQNIQILGRFLMQERYQVAYAQGGKEALEILQSSKYDLLLLDILMPEMDGFQTCREIRANPDTKDMPIIFLTAMNDIESITKGFELGGQDYVTKPFNSKELIVRVRTHLELKQKRDMLKNINVQLEEKVSERTVQLRNANEQLEIANSKLENLDKSKSDFLLLINHELRTPLNSVLGFAQILENTLQEESNLKYVQRIHYSAERLLNMSEIAFLITSLKAENYKVSLQAIQIIEIINLLVEDISTKAVTKNVEIINTLESEDLKIFADKELIFKCMKLVLENALRFSPENEQILIDAFEEENSIIIEVIDAGPGFSEEALENLFNYFSVPDIKHHQEGFGLGLAAAKLIMDNLSGNITVENREPKGASIKLIFKSDN